MFITSVVTHLLHIISYPYSYFELLIFLLHYSITHFCRPYSMHLWFHSSFLYYFLHFLPSLSSLIFSFTFFLNFHPSLSSYTFFLNFFLHFLPSLPSYITFFIFFLHFLPTLSSFISFLHFLPSLSSFISFLYISPLCVSRIMDRHIPISITYFYPHQLEVATTLLLKCLLVATIIDAIPGHWWVSSLMLKIMLDYRDDKRRWHNYKINIKHE